MFWVFKHNYWSSYVFLHFNWTKVEMWPGVRPIIFGEISSGKKYGGKTPVVRVPVARCPAVKWVDTNLFSSRLHRSRHLASKWDDDFCRRTRFCPPPGPTSGKIIARLYVHAPVRLTHCTYYSFHSFQRSKNSFRNFTLAKEHEEGLPGPFSKSASTLILPPVRRL